MVTKKSQFQKSSEFYNLIYQNKDSYGEAAYIDKFIKRFKKNTQKILELGCGTGRHLLEMLKLGYKVKGIDISNEMLKLIPKLDGVELECSDIVNFRSDIKFDVITALFHVVSYVNELDSLDNLFRNTKENLNKGGLFIFDIWFSPAVMNIMPSTRVMEVSNNNYEITRLAIPKIDYLKNIIQVDYKFFIFDKINKLNKTFEETHLMRHYSIPEIDSIAKKYGFEKLINEEWLTGNKPSNKTWGIVFIYKNEQ